MSVNKEAVQANMVAAIERDAPYSLAEWTTHELHDLEFAADLWNAKHAHTVILAELSRRITDDEARTVSIEQYNFKVTVTDVEEGALVYEVLRGWFDMEDGTQSGMTKGDLLHYSQKLSPLIVGLLWKQLNDEKNAI